MAVAVLIKKTDLFGVSAEATSADIAAAGDLATETLQGMMSPEDKIAVDSIDPLNVSAEIAAAVLVETTRAEAAEAANAAGIATNAAGISAETSRAEVAETANATAITTETARAEAAEALKLAKASNLSDLASAPTARTNLGISTVGHTGQYSDLTGIPAPIYANIYLASGLGGTSLAAIPSGSLLICDNSLSLTLPVAPAKGFWMDVRVRSGNSPSFDSGSGNTVNCDAGAGQVLTAESAPCSFRLVSIASNAWEALFESGNAIVASGTFTSVDGGGVYAYDTSASFAPNVFVGFQVAIYTSGGVLRGVRTITSNQTTQLDWYNPASDQHLSGLSIGDTYAVRAAYLLVTG